MEVCPAGFFCFDKNTLVLSIVFLILLVVFYINKNNDKFYRLEKDLDRNKQDIENKITTYKSQINDLTNQNINLEKRDIVNLFQQRVYNPLAPPERTSPHRLPSQGVAINIPTRGYSTGYQQVGALIQEDGSGNNQKILPLYGEQTYPGSRQWKYYTGSDGFQSIKLPVINSGKDCQDTYGCDEIYDGNVVNVKGHDSGFKANIYKLDAPRYLPHVI